MRRCASATCAAQEEACQSDREEPSAGAPAVQREAHQRGREEPSAPAEQGDGSPMHWLTLVFSNPDEEMLFRRNTLVANKTLILACGGMGLSCFVVLWFAAARNGPHVAHALWTPWSIGVVTVILMYLLAAEGDTMAAASTIAAASAYFASFSQALLYGLEPLANFCRAGGI